MNAKIAVILQARLNSQRCKNKMLRNFANSSLFEIQLKKMSELSKNSDHNFYCAVGEKPFYKILEKYKTIKLVKRNKKSVNADLIEDVFNYLINIPEEVICFVNACAPLLNHKTLNKALEKYNELQLTSLTTVLEKKTWYFDEKYKPINDNSACNTKVLSPFFECTHNFHIFKKKYFIENKKYWDNKKNDPYLFNVNLLESLDIDTEDEFMQAEKIYSLMKY